MSDREFWKFFSGLIGALVVLTVALGVSAQVIGDKSAPQALSTAQNQALAERVRPVGEVIIASNAVLNALIPAAQAAQAAGRGEATYKGTCAACHGTGVAGAPTFGNKAAWAHHIAKGKATLYKHALGGFQGSAGLMPPKGGNTSLPDADVKAAVDYMVAHSK